MLQWSTIKVFMSQHSQQRFPDECFSLLISIRKPHEPVTPALIGRWVKKLNDKESIPQYPCSWWNDAVSFDSLRCSKLLLLLLVDLQSHLLNVQMSFFLHLSSQKRVLTIKQSEPLKTWTWKYVTIVSHPVYLSAHVTISSYLFLCICAISHYSWWRSMDQNAL